MKLNKFICLIQLKEEEVVQTPDVKPKPRHESAKPTRPTDSRDGSKRPTTSPVKGRDNIDRKDIHDDPPISSDDEIVTRNITFERKVRKEGDDGGWRKLGPDDDDRLYREIVYSRSTSGSENDTEHSGEINSPISCEGCIGREKTEADLKEQLKKVEDKENDQDHLLKASWKTMKTIKKIITEARDPKSTNKRDRETIIGMIDSELKKLTHLKVQIEGGYSNVTEFSYDENIKKNIEELNQQIIAIELEKKRLGLALEKT